MSLHDIVQEMPWEVQQIFSILHFFCVDVSTSVVEQENLEESIHEQTLKELLYLIRGNLCINLKKLLHVKE
jgi:hypothetical protein